MEKNYVVMTDSSADLNPALEQELGVDIIPLSVNCGDRTFLDYPDEREIKTSEFYGMLRSGANAKTAAANVETFLTAMSRHLEQGKDVLYLGFSSGLSSTYSASEIAAQELRERYPERKVLTVDTLCASMGQGLLVWLTVQELKHGATLEEALLAVPDSYREGSLALGAGKLRTVFTIVLPSAMPGILSGVILATGRIVGETAALIYTASSVAKIPTSVFSSTRTLAVHMYLLSNEGLYIGQTYGTAVVLLVLVLVINCLSGFLAGKLAKK